MTVLTVAGLGAAFAAFVSQELIKSMLTRQSRRENNLTIFIGCPIG
jgi:hypothetical protein